MRLDFDYEGLEQRARQERAEAIYRQLIQPVLRLLHRASA